MQLPEQIYTDLTAQLPAIKEALQAGVKYSGELGTRVIQWDIASNVISLLIWGTLLALAVRGFKKHLAWCKKNEWDESTMTIAFWIFPCAIFPATFFVEAWLWNIIKAIFIPELRLIEILSSLVK